MWSSLRTGWNSCSATSTWPSSPTQFPCSHCSSSCPFSGHLKPVSELVPAMALPETNGLDLWLWTPWGCGSLCVGLFCLDIWREREAMWHLCSFAVKVAERSLDEEECGSLGLYGKLVRAFSPHISLAASSYALAASSAVSNVPSHILVFLWRTKQPMFNQHLEKKTQQKGSYNVAIYFRKTRKRVITSEIKKNSIAYSEKNGYLI